MTRFLLFTASFGDGHHQAAAAITAALEDEGVEVREMDGFRSTNRAIARFNELSYEWSTRFFPQGYGVTYNATAKYSIDHPLWAFLALTSRPAAVKAINDFRPDGVLQFFPDHALSKLPGLTYQPFVGVVLTDYSLHSRWFHRNVDAYYIPHESFAPSAAPFNPEQSELVVSGIPVRAAFSSCELSGSAPDQSRPYILFATGGRGLFPDLEQAVLQVCVSLPEHDVYVLCGRNEQMLRRVEKMAQGNPQVHGVPFIHDMASWLQRAYAAIIKPGGITMTECLVSACPMIIYKPQMGQEADNARFAEALGVAVIARSGRQFVEALRGIRDPGVRLRMSERCAAEAKVDAAKRIVRHALDKVIQRGVKSP